MHGLSWSQETHVACISLAGAQGRAHCQFSLKVCGLTFQHLNIFPGQDNEQRRACQYTSAPASQGCCVPPSSQDPSASLWFSFYSEGRGDLQALTVCPSHKSYLRDSVSVPILLPATHRYKVPALPGSEDSTAVGKPRLLQGTWHLAARKASSCSLLM